MTAIPITLVLTGLDPVIHLLRKSLLRRLMDARIKSGHDERVFEERGQGALRTQTPDSIFKQQKQFQIRLRDLAARCARGLHLSSALKRAWGMPGARCTRGLVCTLYW
jgi:hypothetical protein